MVARRTRLEVLNDMLKAIQNARGGGIKPTHLMYKANLSHKLLIKYMDDLLSRGMVVEFAIDDKHKNVKLTDRGREFLVKFRKIKEFQDSFGL